MHRGRPRLRPLASADSLEHPSRIFLPKNFDESRRMCNFAAENEFLIKSFMTRTFFTYLLYALLLGFMTVSFVGCGDDEDELTIKETVVKVDENGNAKGGHRFSAIDDSNFLIDGIKYTAKSGDIFVTGYDEAYFKGEAKIITALDYQGRRLEVKGIEKEAFRGCNALTAIYIPSSVTTIGGAAFFGCTGLTSITIPNGVTSIGDVAFYGCTGLTSITIPNSVTSIGASAFYGCTGLTSITIPNGVTSIGDAAFSGCTGLTSITIPNSVTSIGASAFKYCTGLTSITIPNGVTTIGIRVFDGCTGLTSITIPNSVTYIGGYAFYDCTGLTSVTIGSGVTSICEEAFNHCVALKDVYCLAEEVPTCDDYSFHYETLSEVTLHVPAASIDAYRLKRPWNDFGSIVAIE